jgi:hypothetical protein
VVSDERDEPTTRKRTNFKRFRPKVCTVIILCLDLEQVKQLINKKGKRYG